MKKILKDPELIKTLNSIKAKPMKSKNLNIRRINPAHLVKLKQYGYIDFDYNNQQWVFLSVDSK